MESMLLLVVSICSGSDCNSFEPYSWDIDEPYAVEIALEECATLAKAYEQLNNTRDVGCYFTLPDELPASSYISDEDGKAKLYY